MQIETVKDLIEELKKYPEDAKVLRVMTSEWGKTHIEDVRLEGKTVVID